MAARIRSRFFDVARIGRALTLDNRDRNYVWKRCCVVFVDAVAYSTSIEKSLVKTRRRLADHFDAFEHCCLQRNGRIIDKAGDGIFAEFPTAHNGISCALDFQKAVEIANENTPADQRMRFRCGIAFGDVLQEKELISGPKVNIAARLQQLAEPGAVNIDGDARRELEGVEEYSFSDLGFRVLKGLSNPVRVWRVFDSNNQLPQPSVGLAADYRDQDVESADARSIACLPFEVPPGSEEDSYMALGMAGDIADALSRSPWLKVISPRSSMNYSTANYDNVQAAKELGVRYLLRGRIRWAGDTVRFSVSLVDCATEHTVWAENYDRQEQGIFELQDEITRLIAGMIEPEFLRHEAQLAASGRQRNVNAWDLLMRSRWHFWRGSGRHFNEALACAEKSLQLEPDSSETMAQLSFCHMASVWTGSSKNIKFQIREALRFAQSAVRLDENNPNAYFTLGTALSLTGELDKAIAAVRRALELNPNSAESLGELARLLVFDGKSEEARRAALKAIELSPSDPHISLWVRSISLASFIEGDFEAASRYAGEASAKRPDWYFHHMLLASCQALNGKIDEAQQSFADGSHLVPVYSMTALKVGHPFSSPEHLEKLVEGLRLAGWDSD